VHVVVVGVVGLFDCLGCWGCPVYMCVHSIICMYVCVLSVCFFFCFLFVSLYDVFIVGYIPAAALSSCLVTPIHLTTTLKYDVKIIKKIKSKKTKIKSHSQTQSETKTKSSPLQIWRCWYLTNIVCSVVS